jgi:PhnB protein
MSISLSGDDEAELSGYDEKLCEGGTVMEPVTKAPWGDQLGMVTNRDGTCTSLAVLASSCRLS